MKSTRTALLVLALCSASAYADDRTTALQASLAADGMTPISAGLYGRRDGGNEAYVAYTSAGRQALLQRLLELRAARPAAAKTAGAAPNVLDRLIDQLSAASVSKGRDGSYGDCDGPAPSGPFHVQASANGGLNASASAQNTSSPTINTTNTAYAMTSDFGGNETGYQSATTQGNTPATASAVAPSSRDACLSDSAATVSCPGAADPAIVAFASSQVNPNLACRI